MPAYTHQSVHATLPQRQADQGDVFREMRDAHRRYREGDTSISGQQAQIAPIFTDLELDPLLQFQGSGPALQPSTERPRYVNQQGPTNVANTDESRYRPSAAPQAYPGSSEDHELALAEMRHARASYGLLRAGGELPEGWQRNIREVSALGFTAAELDPLNAIKGELRPLPKPGDPGFAAIAASGPADRHRSGRAAPSSDSGRRQVNAAAATTTPSQKR